MIPEVNKTGLSLQRLFECYRVAVDREKFWGRQLVEDVTPVESETWFTYWNMERKLLYAEIESRANRITTDALKYLIETCNPFTLIDEPAC